MCICLNYYFITESGLKQRVIIIKYVVYMYYVFVHKHAHYHYSTWVIQRTLQACSIVYSVLQS